MERAAPSIHAFEFAQLNFEIRNASSIVVRVFVETVLTRLMEKVGKTAKNEFEVFGVKPATL